MIRPMLVTVVPESTPGVWAVVAAGAALLAVFLFIACLVYRKFSTHLLHLLYIHTKDT